MFGSANRQSRIGQLRLGVAFGVLPVFASTLFVSALLLFWVQPMFTKMVLPMLGGAPAVWNTAMLFFQATLLAGYGYAHLVTRFLGLRWQVLLHLAVLVVAVFVLPVDIAEGWAPPTRGTPVFWLIGLYAVSVGPPFFVISASAPLLQRWFSQTGHETASDPYFLYGACNVGSILALFAYPVVLEPMLSLSGQSWAWTTVYAVLCVMIAACALKVVRRVGAARSSLVGVAPQAEVSAPLGWRRRAHWVFLAFVPSSLLLGVTSHITTDVAAAPFLWVIPLALYLLTFVLTFAKNPPIRHEVLVRAQPFIMVVGAMFFWGTQPFSFVLPLHLAVFFVAAMVCHGELIGRRPEASRLTEFYLCLSIGGMLGGVFNALIAPALLDSVAEYPLMLALACLARPWPSRAMQALRRFDLLAPVGIGVFIVVVDVILGQTVTAQMRIALVLLLVIVPALALLARNRPVGFALSIGTLLVFGPIVMQNGEVLVRERSFFGVYSVLARDGGSFHEMMHGTTSHGGQFRDAERRRMPTAYYSPASPVGRLFEALYEARPPRRVAVIGLGSGALSCYRRDGQIWSFYEIDPTVTTLARNLRYFHQLTECAPDARIVHGDARLSLMREPAGQIDLLIGDAFSSDTIPVHLVTREAVELYLEKLAPRGVLVVNISNRNVDLKPVFASITGELGLSSRISTHLPTPDQRANGALVSTWVAVAREGELAFLDELDSWDELERSSRRRIWTDDYSNIFGALHWW